VPGIRSPNYPRLSLAEAVDKTRLIWEKIERGKMAAREISAVLGYASFHGSAQGVISSLKKFGLLAGRRDQLGVSAEAVAIVARSPGMPERVAALERAAFRYPLFREIHSTLPAEAGDEELRHFLLERGFSRNASTLAVEAYRGTVDLLEKERGSGREPVGAPTAEARLPVAAPSPPAPLQVPAASPPPAPGETAARPGAGSPSIVLDVTKGAARIRISIEGEGAPIARILELVRGFLEPG
jgi:hypothetical protein